jgi:hypothetical protein
MKLNKLSKIIMFLVLFLIHLTLLSIVNKITFEEPPITTPPPNVQVRFSNLGLLVLNRSAKLYNLSASNMGANPKSPHHVLVSRAWPSEFDEEPLRLRFTCGVEEVTLHSGVPWDPRGHQVTITVEAFDKTGKLVDRKQRNFHNKTDVDIPFRLEAPHKNPIIWEIKIDARQQTNEGKVGFFEFIDDIIFKSEIPPPPQAQEPPKIIIEKPTVNNTKYPDILVSGKIYGKGIFPEFNPPEVRISWPISSTATAGGYVYWSQYPLNLGQHLFWMIPNQSLSFSFPFKLTYFGKNTITVSACNAKGKVKAHKSITYFPPPIQSEYHSKGGASRYGTFIWGTTIGNCMFAIYQKGAILHSSAGTYSCFGKIFQKWSNMITNIGFSALGCALGSEKLIAGGSFQNFVNGRIYSGSKGAFVVMEPFIKAIDQLNFVKNYGLPVSDTVFQSSKAYILPIQWQKFQRTIAGHTFVSTMEITEDPKSKQKILWLATPDFEGVKRAGLKEQEFTSRLPFVWRSINCSSQGGVLTCSPVKKKATMKLSYNALKKVCNNSNYPFGSAPAWASLASKKIIPYMGNISSSGLSGKDHGACHSCDTWGIGGGLFDGVDFCIHVVADPEYEHRLRETIPVSKRLIGPFEQKDLEVEYEYCVVGYPEPNDWSDMSKGAKPGTLVKGDKMYLAGRWISDCGCHPSFPKAPSQYCQSPYKTEIHPPAIMINMYTGKELGKTATIAELVYFDWWYPGEKVEIDVFPPPRPTPTATLVYHVPLWTTFCKSDKGKCGIKYISTPAGPVNHVHLIISGRPDVGFNTPPKEAGNGELFHGYVPPAGRERYVPGANYPHTKSLVGDIVLYWKVN